MIQYLGNYTHRVAISESRLLAHTDTSVTFAWKDYADESKQKIMTVDTVEFIRRFLLHVLPSGFMRIRHYGFLANGNRKRSRVLLEAIFKSLESTKSKTDKTKEKKPWHQHIEEQTGVNPLLCKKCGKAVLVQIRELFPQPGKGLACLTDT